MLRATSEDLPIATPSSCTLKEVCNHFLRNFPLPVVAGRGELC